MIHFKDAFWWMALFLVGGLLILTFFYYRRTIPPLKKAWRIGLGVTRALALLLLLLALAETLLSLSPEVADPPVAVGLIDVSASMYDETAGGGSSVRAGKLWERVVDRLSANVRPERLFVAESLLVGDRVPDSGGQATALGTALGALRRRFEAKNLAAVFLFSDGNNNFGPGPAEAAQDLGVPIVAVGMGEPDTALTPEIVALDVDQVVLAKRPFKVTVGATAPRAGSVRLRLLRGIERIDERTIDVAAPGRRVETQFETSVQEAGIHHFRVEPAALPEAGRSFFVKALKDKARVLLFGFRPDWEFAFLRRVLGQMPDCELYPVLLGVDGRSVLEPVPLASEWSSYDAVILVGPDQRWLKSNWTSAAGEAVRAGRGMLLILGENSLSPSGATLPFPLEFVTGPPLWKRGEFSPSVEPGNLRHPLLRLEDNPEDSRRILESFPPFAGIWDIPALPERATALLSYRPPGLNTPDYRTIPLIWTSRQGGSKALVINGGPLWRWSFNSAVEPGGANYYARFLSLAMRWLTVTEDLQKQRVEADKEVYASGEPISFRGYLYDDGYRFLARASVVARVWPDSATASTDSATVFLPPGGGDYYEGRLTGLRPGVYAYAAAAALDNDTLALAGGKLNVEVVGLEKSARGLNEVRMRAIAENSGGRYYRETQTFAVLDSLAFKSRTYTTRREIELWNRPWLLAAMLVLLSGEWFFRKRRQLL